MGDEAQTTARGEQEGVAWVASGDVRLPRRHTWVAPSVQYVGGVVREKRWAVETDAA